MCANVLEFLRVVGKLKRTKRAGWVLNGVPQAESVADHMYRMGIIAMVVADPKLVARATKMALVHDLAEALVGDITPRCGVSKEEKARREQDALAQIVRSLDKPMADEISALFFEYERGESECARLVKEIDKFEMILQADEYETTTSIDLQEFFDSTQGYFKTDVMHALARQLREERAARLRTAAARRDE